MLRVNRTMLIKEHTLFPCAQKLKVIIWLVLLLCWPSIISYRASCVTINLYSPVRILDQDGRCHWWRHGYQAKRKTTITAVYSITAISMVLQYTMLRLVPVTSLVIPTAFYSHICAFLQDLHFDENYLISKYCCCFN